MDADFSELLREHRATVLAELARFDHDLASLRHSRTAADGDDEHDPEGSTLSTDWSRLTGLRTEARARRDQIEAAQQRLDAGTFGLCVRCGAPIPMERLLLRPWATEHVVCPEVSDAGR